MSEDPPPKTRRITIAMLWISVTIASAAGAPDDTGVVTTFHVSPTGDDDWSGTVAARTGDGSDGPFATIARAQRAVRGALAGGTIDGPVVVSIRGGVYELAEPVVLTPRDSGTPASPVIYRAHTGERPVLSGGRRITGWRIGDDGTWRVTLPEVADGGWRFAQLWVDDQRRFRPWLPADGYHRVAEEVAPTEASAGRGHDRFGFHAGDIDPTWPNLDQVEVLAFHIWSASRMRIADIDADRRIVTFTGPTRTTNPWGAFRKGHRYRIVNAVEALETSGTPGRWHLDHATGELTYARRPGETPAEATVVAPLLDTLVRLEGDPATGRHVEHIRLEGLTFAHANWTLPSGGQSFPQAEVHQRAAIEAVGARHITLDACVIRHVGGYALAFGAGCRDNTVQQCELIDLGAGGIKIGTSGGPQSWPATDRDGAGAGGEVTGNTVRDCLIAHGGRLHPAAVGVWIGHASHSAIEHNDIHDFYYTGVSVGWTWGYAEPSRAHHNEIAYNRIRDIGQGVLSDLAGVYTLGVSPGTTVHHNVIHDVDAFDYGAWGLYTDEGSSGIVMSHNLVYRTKTGGFHQHYGRENVVTNNIFAEARVQQLQRTRTEAHRSFTFERNLVYWTNESPLLGSNWRDDNFVLEGNVYWNPGHPDIRFPGDLTLEQWREQRGQDRASVIADPLFVDPSRDDYRLRDGSPALALGFETWDFEQAGRTRSPALTRAIPAPPAGFE